ncbi:hypothetical protein [uncultured Croceitalea sp.]|uniref:hypothetical protein n=1 Tax=uncultured Croceitalea sp. TaxID=1798908 RepID=UPI00374FA1B9
MENGEALPPFIHKVLLKKLIEHPEIEVPKDKVFFYYGDPMYESIKDEVHEEVILNLETQNEIAQMFLNSFPSRSREELAKMFDDLESMEVKERITSSIENITDKVIGKNLPFPDRMKSKQNAVLIKFCWIIPKSNREEALADLKCMISEMQESGYLKAYIFSVIVLHIVSILFSVLWLELISQFYPKRQQTGKD